MKVKSSIILLTYLLFMTTPNYDKNGMSMKVGCFNYGRKNSVLRAFLCLPEWPVVSLIMESGSTTLMSEVLYLGCVAALPCPSHFIAMLACKYLY